MLFSKFLPRSKFSPQRSAAPLRVPGRAGMLSFYEDRNNFVTYTLKGVAFGAIGSAYRAILFRSGSNRFSCRVWDPDNTLLATVTTAAGIGMPDLLTKVQASGVLNPILDVKISGSISSTQDFSKGITIDSADSFAGGQG